MNNDIKKLWLEALRGGKYKQNFNALKTDDQYCILGVLCDLFPGGWWEDGVAKIPTYFYPFSGRDIYREKHCLPEPVMEWAGLEYIDPIIMSDDPSQFFKEKYYAYPLTRINDDLEYSFDQLADIIEKYL